jgi:hypothetical protein
MQAFCEWCGSKLSEPEGAEQSMHQVTLGVCEDCGGLLAMSRPSLMSGFLDSLQAPVLAIDSDGIVVSCNELAMHTLAKPLDKISGERGGDVMNCVFSKEPGGCGNTIHCKACTIRRLVMITHETGVSVSNVPAYLYTPERDNIRKIKFFLSTEHVDSIVLLRIDSAAPDELVNMDQAIGQMQSMFESQN